MSSLQEIHTPNATVVRRTRLLALLSVFVQEQVTQGHPPKGLEQAFAAKLQISPSLLSQIKNSRPIGDKLARQIESACAVPSGYLDTFVASTISAPSPAEDAFMATARNAWRAANAKEKRDLARHLKEFISGKSPSAREARSLRAGR